MQIISAFDKQDDINTQECGYLHAVGVANGLFNHFDYKVDAFVHDNHQGTDPCNTSLATKMPH